MRFGLQVLPSDPHDRAVARFWAAYLDDKVWQKAITVTLCNNLYLAYTQLF